MISDKTISIIAKIVSNSASEAETEAFNNWLESSEDNQKLYAHIKTFWDNVPDTNKRIEFDESAAREKIIAQIRQKNKKTVLTKARFWIPAAASVLFLLGIWCITQQKDEICPDPIAYHASQNEVLDIVLPDGSEVWLNANSIIELSNSFGKQQRKVKLKGEAYFEVARNEKKAFKVITGGTTAKVLGTSFYLKSNNKDKVLLIVNSGKVKFRKHFRLQKGMVFSAGEKGAYSAAGNRLSKEKNNNVNYLSWKTGILSFSDTPLSEVCTALTNHFRVPVKSNLQDSVFSITGTFKNERLENILTTISLTLDIEISDTENGIVMVK
jgi:ferric-dicitrate binding protein FerR (iron transport regulator)